MSELKLRPTEPTKMSTAAKAAGGHAPTFQGKKKGASLLEAGKLKPACRRQACPYTRCWQTRGDGCKIYVCLARSAGQ